MKNRGLALVIVFLVIGLFANSAYAQRADAYVDGRYMTGQFNYSDSKDSFTREGLAIGIGFRYNFSARVNFVAGSEFYFGSLDFSHQEKDLKGSASYLEMGEKEWLKTTVDLHHGVKIGGRVGFESTRGTGFDVNNVQISLGGGWFDFTDLAKQHLLSSGGLDTWEGGVDVQFPFYHKFSFTFGALWQRYHVVIHLNADAEGQKLLEALHYNVSKVDRDFEHTANFFSLSPGVQRCGEKLCVSLTIPWGVFEADKWSYGAVLKTEVKF